MQSESVSSETATPTTAGYSLVLPPGWVRIPLRGGTDEAIRTVVKRAFAKPPRDVPRDEPAKLRVQLEARLRDTATQAAESDGLDLYLPTAPRGGVGLTGSFIVSEIRLRVGDSLNADDITGELAARASSQKVSVDGRTGARTERALPANESRGAPYASRQVNYVLPVPKAPGRWLTIAYSTPADGNPEGEYADLLVELFDAIMSTFDWILPERPEQAALDGA
ncbi:hypothetical protein [Streptomyces sp. NPDC051776]|uniref:hypothetical protein n=1 Tax=Streptomyces sp. NPDC051776 TaxID=3155414 RepID=UPI00342016DF